MFEILLQDAPALKVKHVAIVRYYDGHHCYNVVMGSSVTKVLHFINKTLVDWHSKKQATVKTGAYSSNYSSDRTYVE